MRRNPLALLFALAWSAGPALAANPEVFHPGSGVEVPQQGGRDVLWSQPGMLGGDKVSSEIISSFGIVTEVAGDFVLACDGPATITSITWWGGQWGWSPGDPICALFHLILYAEDPDPDRCVPFGDPIATYVDVLPEQTDLGQEPFQTNFRYDLPIVIELQGGTRYWIVVQAADHTFPGQWGRMEAVDTQGCESYFRGAYFGFPDWTTLTEVTGTPHNDASLELVGYCGGVPTQRTTWGSIRGLYR